MSAGQILSSDGNDTVNQFPAGWRILHRLRGGVFEETPRAEAVPTENLIRDDEQTGLW